MRKLNRNQFIQLQNNEKKSIEKVEYYARLEVTYQQEKGK